VASLLATGSSRSATGALEMLTACMLPLRIKMERQHRSSAATALYKVAPVPMSQLGIVWRRHARPLCAARMRRSYAMFVWNVLLVRHDLVAMTRLDMIPHVRPQLQHQHQQTHIHAHWAPIVQLSQKMLAMNQHGLTLIMASFAVIVKCWSTGRKTSIKVAQGTAKLLAWLVQALGTNNRTPAHPRVGLLTVRADTPAPTVGLGAWQCATTKSNQMTPYASARLIRGLLRILPMPAVGHMTVLTTTSPGAMAAQSPANRW